MARGARRGPQGGHGRGLPHPTGEGVLFPWHAPYAKRDPYTLVPSEEAALRWEEATADTSSRRGATTG